jgi:hypothetical protein
MEERQGQSTDDVLCGNHNMVYSLRRQRGCPICALENRISALEPKQPVKEGGLRNILLKCRYIVPDIKIIEDEIREYLKKEIAKIHDYRYWEKSAITLIEEAIDRS